MAFIDLYMKEALLEANKALEIGEIPVGAVIVKDGVIIAKGHNTREKYNNIVGHAEINAIIEAEKKLNSWKLDGCELYVTLEPCMMCSGAIKDARIKQVFYGCKDIDHGGSKYIAQDIIVSGGHFEQECSEILKLYFKDKRNNK